MDEAKVERWLTDAVAEESAMVVYQLGEKLVDQHGEMPEQAILKAVDRLVQRNRAMTYTGKVDQQEKPANLVHGPAAIMHATKNTDVLITPAEAAQRGWVREEDIAFTLRGADAVKRILPLLGKLGSLYSRGAKSKVDALDLADLEVGGGGRLRLVLENMTPAGMKNLAELFESLAIVAKAGSHSEAEIEIKSPVDGCVLMETLRSAR